MIDSPDDVAALTRAVTALCDEDHRRACAEAAPQATSGISMREHARQAMRLYEELVKAGALKRGGYR